jgi:hypothetical protein
MSTTASSSTSTATEHARDPTDLYVLLVHESPEVCSNCHRQIRDHEQHDHDSATLGTGNRPTETLERTGEGVVGYDVTIRDGYGAVRDYHPRTYCGACGQPGGRARDDTPPKTAMLDAVKPLLERFDAADIPLNPDVLQRAVGHLRSQPEYCGSETEIWRAVVAVAAKHARPRDCVRCTYGSHDDDGL